MASCCLLIYTAVQYRV